MRMIVYAALGMLIATPALSVPLKYVDFTYYQPGTSLQSCGTEFSYGNRWDGHCGELGDDGKPIEKTWVESDGAFELATLWINDAVDRRNLIISSSDTKADWEDSYAYREWGIIPFGVGMPEIGSWADGHSTRHIEFTIEFDARGQISAWMISGYNDGSDGFAAFSRDARSDPWTWNDKQYFGSMYWEPAESFIYRDRGYWVTDAVPSPIPLPASGLLLLAGIAGIGCMRWRAKAA